MHIILPDGSVLDDETGELLPAVEPSTDQTHAQSPGEQSSYTPDISPLSSRIVTGDDYLRLPREPETWLIQPLLPTGGSLLLYGDPKVGKSFAALQLAEALATGRDWLGFRTPRPGRVVYIQLDTPRSLWSDRVENLKAAGLATGALYFADRETLGLWPFDILDPSHRSQLASELKRIEPDCVIIDTLRECHRGDENDATDMQAVISHLESTVKPAALILIAHGRKGNAEAGPSLINDNRGSNYVVGKMDAIVHFTPDLMQVGGRAVEEMDTRIERHRLPGGGFLWGLTDRQRVKELAKDLMEDPSLPTLRAKAKVLSERVGKDESACLSILTRLQKH